MGRSTDAARDGDPENHPYADRPAGGTRSTRSIPKGKTMILATTQVEDIERFLDVFSTKGADKRAEHGSTGANVFRDPTEENRVWVLFDWDEAGWANFVSDPEVLPIIKEAGHLDKPQAATFLGTYRA
jgi:quinol monooxygenase YgiN